MVNDKDNYDLLQKLLIQIHKRQDGLNIRRFAGRSVEENENGNKKFTSEELVTMTAGLCTTPGQQENPLNAYTKNGNILAIFNLLDDIGKITGSARALVPLFCKGGLTKICQLYNALLKEETSSGKNLEGDANFIRWQRRAHLKLLSTILTNLIELKGLEHRSNQSSFEQCKITEETAPYNFTSL
jgi:hypothetical protein